MALFNFGSILSTFYVQLFQAQILKSQKKTDNLTGVDCTFGIESSHLKVVHKMLIKFTLCLDSERQYCDEYNDGNDDGGSR